MMNLFSLFDPSNSILMINFWSAILMSVIFKNMKKNFFKKINLMMEMEFLNNNKFQKKMMEKFCISMFMFFSLMNLINLLPYTFITTSMMNMNTSILMNSWFTIMIMTMVNFKKEFFIKLTPPSTPSALMPFMVMIEMMSILIRPMTLNLRISANMISGHITMLMISYSLTKMSIMNLMIFPFMVISVMETAMAIIQAYIIMTLISLFFSEMK